MKRQFHTWILSLAFSALLVCPATAYEQAESEAWEACCAKHRYLSRVWSASLKDDASDALKFAPDRLIDVSHVKLDITPDFDRRSLTGVAEIAFSPIAKSLTSVRLDSVDLDIESVEASVPVKEFSVGKEHLEIVF